MIDLAQLTITSTEALNERYVAIQDAMRRTTSGVVHRNLGDKLEAISAELQRRNKGTADDPYRGLSHDLEKEYIERLLGEMTPAQILTIHGIWEHVREYFANDVINLFERENPELLPDKLRAELAAQEEE